MEEIWQDLRVAIDENDLEIFQDLLEKYPDLVNYIHLDSNSWTPLLSSVYHKREEMIQILVNLGADIDCKNYFGISALEIAVELKYYEIAKFLLESGANVNTQTNEGFTPLHGAVFNHDVRMVEMLLEYGADINIQNREGKTPLYYAKTEEMRELLLSGGLPGPKRAEK